MHPAAGLAYMDRLALLTLAKAETLPASPDLVEKTRVAARRPGMTVGIAAKQTTKRVLPPGPPSLYVTLEGNTIQELTFDKDAAC